VAGYFLAILTCDAATGTHSNTHSRRIAGILPTPLVVVPDTKSRLGLKLVEKLELRRLSVQVLYAKPQGV
jgi:hypothetical protein